MAKKYQYNVIGLMSGTSLDGLDIVYCEFKLIHNQWTYLIHDTLAIHYTEDWQGRLHEAIKLSSVELDELNTAYGIWLGTQVKEFIVNRNITVDLVSSHGHTVFHEPAKGITLQIGDGQALADVSGIKTICDFRKLDVELGGQGAPLVPIGDQLLFPDYSACLNLGGIANISYESGGHRIAYDIGMANMPLNHVVKKAGLRYDKDGLLASRGEVDEQLLSKLNSIEYYHLPPPKSLGIEWFLRKMLPILDAYEISIEDKLATLVEHQSLAIAKAISLVPHSGNILVTGGGALNSFFVSKITDHIGSDTSIFLPEQELIDFKEALIFGLMGVLRIREENNCLQSVTGARRDSSSGSIFKPKAS